MFFGKRPQNNRKLVQEKLMKGIFYIKKFLTKYGILVIFLIFLLTTFGCFYNKSYDNQDFDYLRLSGESINKIVFQNYGDQLPLWFLLVKGYTSIFGKSEIALRIFTILIFLLSAFVLYKLCEVYKVNKYLIPALYLFNPLLLVDTAYVFKHWSFLILTCLLALYYFEKFKITKKKRYFLFLILAIIAGVYSNLIFLIYLFTLIIYLLANVISKKISYKPFILFLVILIVFASPLYFYLNRAENQLFKVQAADMNWGTSSRGFDFIKESLSIITGVKYLNDYNLLSKALILIILFLIVFQFFLKKGYITKLWLILTVSFVLIALMIMASRTPVRFRYFALTVPFFYLAIIPRSKKIYIPLLGIALLFITAFSSIQAAKDFQPADWKRATSFLENRIKDDSQLLLIYKFRIGPFIMDYYLDRPVKRIQSLEDPSILSADDIWIIRVSGNYNKVYQLYSEYDIEEYNDFQSMLLIHLTKRENPPNANQLIFKKPLVEIITGGERKTCQFLNGAITSNCYNKEWQRIRIDKITSGDEDKICLFVHPRNDTKINLIYKDVKLDESIRFTTGISDDMVIGNLSPIYIDVYIDNEFVKRIIQPDIKGWLATDIDTGKYKNKSVEVKLIIYTDYAGKRHFCFDAEVVDEKTVNDYFYRNLKNAKAAIDNKLCEIYRTDSIWPHNETKPPFLDSKIFERWDCEEDLVSKNRIWNTIGKSYAIADNEFKEAIWIHPLTDKAKSLEYKNINLYTDKITGYYGLNDLAISKNLEATLTFTIMVNGEKIYEDEFIPTTGWKNFEIYINKKINSVVFSITSTNNRWNHFFFNAFLED